ncbi:MAG: GDP-mannose 4,6-dehydratase [Candidatus Giovannonibacteria bacterium]|nr:GDP-mannose 4,6-dehydratase [Candidatus Giovannonibacteria bacterium]
MAKKAMITGITGQDGSYLAELLLEKGYEVYGLQRRASLPNTERVDHLYENSDVPRFNMVYADLTDGQNLSRLIQEIKPDEIYNIGAQSHVGVSFEIPEFTVNTNALGPLRILEAIRASGRPIKYYQASSSEMFGKALAIPQNETTPFNPQSPYGISKVAAFYLTKTYRTGYNMFASNGILFNHESPRRGLNFVSRKISLGLSRVKLGLQPTVRLGNLEARRDWSFAKDYVEAIWRILQHNVPDDFVIATGETHSVREMVEEAGKCLGMEIEWRGKGVDEAGIDRKTGRKVVEIDTAYFRPNEVDYLQGDPTKARTVLGWKPKVTFKELVKILTEHDYDYALAEEASGKPIVHQKRFRHFN